MDLEQRLIDLYGELGAFKPTDNAGWQVGLIFNALLEEAKKAFPDDPIVKVIEPARDSGFNTAVPDAGTLRAAVSQLLNAARGQ